MPTKRDSAAGLSALSKRGQFLVSRCLSTLIDNPPIVEPPKKFGLYDLPVYRKSVNDVVTQRMSEAGYKIDAVFKWDEEYEEFVASIERVPWPHLNQTRFEESLRRALQNIEDTKRKPKVDAKRESLSDEEFWEDVDLSMASVSSTTSISSKASERSTRLTNAKRSMQNQMRESAKKKMMRLASFAAKPDGQGTTPMKKTPASSATDISGNNSSSGYVSSANSNNENSSGNGSGSSKTTRNNSISNTSNVGSERTGRSLKRQASGILVPDGKAKKTRPPSVDRAGFARSQNSRVQLVKERKELQEKERLGQIEAKLQQKGKKLSKDQKPVGITSSTSTATSAVASFSPYVLISALPAKTASSSSATSSKLSTGGRRSTKKTPSSSKVSSSSASTKPAMAPPPPPPKVTTKALAHDGTAAGSNSNAAAATRKNQAAVFAKPAVPLVMAVKSAPALRVTKNNTNSNSPLRQKNVQPVGANGGGGNHQASPSRTMQNKARDDLRHGNLAKQAMYQSMIVAGDPEGAHCVNSTFLPGEETAPNFNASLALTVSPSGQTFVVGSGTGAAQKAAAMVGPKSPVVESNATFVSKPGLVRSPALERSAANLDVSTFIDSFNESFRDYGLEDLCSDSDNTDDENQPNKRVPKWADLRGKRFKNRIASQKALGETIDKYGLPDIYMPDKVDLEKIFETTSARFHRHNTSSGLWNETHEFIQD